MTNPLLEPPLTFNRSTVENATLSHAYTLFPPVYTVETMTVNNSREATTTLRRDGTHAGKIQWRRSSDVITSHENRNIPPSSAGSLFLGSPAFHIHLSLTIHPFDVLCLTGLSGFELPKTERVASLSAKSFSSENPSADKGSLADRFQTRALRIVSGRQHCVPQMFPTSLLALR